MIQLVDLLQICWSRRVGVRGAVLLLGAGFAAAQSAPTFSATGNLTVPRQFHTATLLTNGKVLIAGGFSVAAGPFESLATAEIYDPSTGRFTATGGMTTRRHLHTATLLPNGKVLIAGGFFQNGIPGQATAELYDPATGSFSATGSMSVPRAAHTATLLNNGKVLITAGDYPASQSAELYDPSTGAFTPTGDMTEAGADTATLLADGRVLITRWADDGTPNHAELYDPAAGAFTRIADMVDSNQGARPTATLLASGKVLIAGGNDGEYGTAIAEDYNPAAGAFTKAANMTASIGSYATATLLPEGTTLIAGRYDGVQCSSSVIGSPPLGRTCPGTAELYDPTAGSFSPPGLFQSMEGHASTLLPDGSVLLTGGWVCCGITIGTAQVYRPAVLVASPALFSVSGDGKGPGAIQHADTFQLVSADNPAVAGEIIVIYFAGLVDASTIPPQLAIGGLPAEVLWFGNTPGYPGLNQINVRVPHGVVPGRAVPVRMNYLARPSNEVTIEVRQ